MKRHDLMRAFALVLKISEGKSYDAMVSIYGRHIEEGLLRLRKIPHQNTQSNWMNDESLTPILEKMLEITAKPFRATECAGIVDSSKMSQMRTAHSRYVEYGDDVREDADWMKMHVLVGVETLVCMGVCFSGSRGKGSHDANFLGPLVEATQDKFALRYVLADKAYLSEKIIGGLFDMGIQAVIPVKKRWDFKNAKQYHEPLQHLVQWYDERSADFHEYYRLRPKIEGFFSLVKRLADGFCWSRGRPRKDAKGVVIPIENALEPCTAWINESLCKLIYVNLRLTVEREISTGYQMNYLRDTFFPAIPAKDKLIA
jgi:hypothetical protein